jgi:hypothetical protein
MVTNQIILFMSQQLTREEIIIRFNESLSKLIEKNPSLVEASIINGMEVSSNVKRVMLIHEILNSTTVLSNRPLSLIFEMYEIAYNGLSTKEKGLFISYQEDTKLAKQEYTRSNPAIGSEEFDAKKKFEKVITKWTIDPLEIIEFLQAFGYRSFLLERLSEDTEKELKIDGLGSLVNGINNFNMRSESNETEFPRN